MSYPLNLVTTAIFDTNDNEYKFDSDSNGSNKKLLIFIRNLVM